MPRAVDAAGAIEQLQSFASSTRSAIGEFTQQLQRKSRQAAPVSRGEFAFARPGRFRWEIREPYEQLIVTDGKKLYFFDKDLKQVTIRAAGDVIRATPAAVLIALDRMERGGDAVNPTGLSAVQQVRETWGLPVYAIATLEDLLGYLDDPQQRDQSHTAHRARIADYRSRFGT